jgi:hypothetical protein
MIYSDGIHIISSISLGHLHEFCKKIGIKRCWFHSGSSYDHYDIPKLMRFDFFERFPEVQQVSSREIIKILKKTN